MSPRRVSEGLSCNFKRNHVSIWYWIQKHYPQKVSTKRKGITGYTIDETLTTVGSEHTWLWVAIEPKNRQTLPLSISKERDRFVAEMLISCATKIHGKHPVSTDGGHGTRWLAGP
jgi:putative transposase